MHNNELSHLDKTGAARMVDVSAKAITSRIATAEGKVIMAQETLSLLQSGQTPKGDVLATARIAGIQAAKQTSNLIPLCHPLPISGVTLDITPDEALPGVYVKACVKVSSQTGVEMEALTAVSIACLTLYDMLKAVDKSMEITSVRLLHKEGGRSGIWQRD